MRRVGSLAAGSLAVRGLGGGAGELVEGIFRGEERERERVCVCRCLAGGRGRCEKMRYEMARFGMCFLYSDLGVSSPFFLFLLFPLSSFSSFLSLSFSSLLRKIEVTPPSVLVFGNDDILVSFVVSTVALVGVWSVKHRS